MTWTRRVKNFEVGDKVAYSASWLRSTGQYAGDMPFARGVITELKKLGDATLATIEWGNPDIPPKVLTANLSKVRERGLTDE